MSVALYRMVCGTAIGTLIAVGALFPSSVAPASASTFVAATISITSPSRADPTPVSIAVDRATSRAFVTNAFDGTVSVIDTRSSAVVATVPNGPTSIGNGPSVAAVDPKHHQVFVTNYNSNTVSVIDTATNEVTAVLPHDPAKSIGSYPYAVALDPNLDRAFVSNVGEGTVSVIDTSVNRVIAVIPHNAMGGIGSYPLGIAIDSTLHRGYVTNNSDDTVSVFDTKTETVIAVIPPGPKNGIGESPRRIAVDEERHHAFVVNMDAASVSVIDTNTNTVTGVIDGVGDSPKGIAVDAAGQQLYVSSEAQLAVIDLTSLTVIRVIKNESSNRYGSGGLDLTVDADHRHAFVVGSATNAVAVVNLDSTAALTRRGGADRFEVSALNSAAEFQPGVGVAYVASGGTFADALSGSATAGAHKAPVLLVSADSIPTTVGGELARLKPKRIVVLGGAASVSVGVEQALRGYAPTVDRLGGQDRYAVSAAISRDGFAPGVPVAYVASGAVFPDALSGSAIAAKDGAPVLLTTRDSIPQPVLDELTRLNPTRIVILGGPNTISPDLENTLRTQHPTTRLTGPDRFAVSAAASTAGFPTGTKTVFIASGNVFPDALSGSPAAAANTAPVLLVTSTDIPAPVAAELHRLHPSQIVVLGGPSSISDTVYNQLRTYTH